MIPALLLLYWGRVDVFIVERLDLLVHIVYVVIPDQQVGVVQLMNYESDASAQHSSALSNVRAVFGRCLQASVTAGEPDSGIVSCLCAIQ